MSRIPLLALFAATMVYGCRAFETLTFDSFFDSLSSNSPSDAASTTTPTTRNIVYFYSPWYRSYKKYMPLYKEVELHFKAKEEPQTTFFFAVDSTSETILSKAMNVKSYPSIFLFHGSKFVEAFFGKPKKLRMVKWIEKDDSDGAKTSAANVKQKAKVQAAVDQDSASTVDQAVEELVGKAVDQDSTPPQPELIVVAVDDSWNPKVEPPPPEPASIVVAKEPSKEQPSKEPSKEPAPAKSTPTTPTIPTTPTTQEPVKEVLPPVLSFNSLVLQQIVKREITIPKSATCQVIFVYSSNDASEKEFTAMYKTVAENTMADASLPNPCVFIAADSLDDKRILKYFDQSKEDDPMMYVLMFDEVGYDRERRWSIGPVQGMYPSDIQHALHAIFDGTTSMPTIWESEPIKMWSSLKSEAKPSTAGTVVGSTFEDLVVKSTGTDVLVLIHATWCQHCKSFLPLWTEMTKLLRASVSTIKTYDMNGELNEVHGVAIQSYPTLLLYPGLDKQRSVAYTGGFDELQSILNWASQHSSTLFNVNKIMKLQKNNALLKNEVDQEDSGRMEL